MPIPGLSAAAETVAMSTISVASMLSLPVSTTHVLSSGIAGTMFASGGLQNLQAKTLKTILSAWVLTLPVTMLLSGLLFWFFTAPDMRFSYSFLLILAMLPILLLVFSPSESQELPWL